MYITSASVGEYSRDISSVYHLSCEWDSNPSQVSFIDLRKYKWILNMVLNAFLLNVEKYTSLTKDMNHWLLSTVPISRDPDLGEWVCDVKIGEIVKIGSGLRIRLRPASYWLNVPIWGFWLADYDSLCWWQFELWETRNIACDGSRHCDGGEAANDCTKWSITITCDL